MAGADAPANATCVANAQVRVMHGVAFARIEWMCSRARALIGRMSTLLVRISAFGHRASWFVVDAGTKKHVADVSYNGRVWLPNGSEAQTQQAT